MSASSISSSEEEKTLPTERELSARKRIVPYWVTAPSPSLPIDVITLCGQAKKETELYVGDQEKSRRRIYKNENQKEYKVVKKATTIRVLKEDAGQNSKIMAITVGIFGGLGSLGWIAGPVGGAPGTALGVAAGLALGGSIIKERINKKINITIDLSDHYAAWRSRAITAKVYPIFKSFLDTDKEFEDFMCPISQDICSVPMLAPDGQTYNQHDIHEWMDSIEVDDNENIVSPVRGKSFCRNDLIFSTQYCRDLIQKAEEVYEDVIKYGKDNEIKYGVAAVIKNTRDIMECVRVQVAFKIWYAYEDQVRNETMTNDERQKIIDDSTRQWDYKDVLKKS